MSISRLAPALLLAGCIEGGEPMANTTDGGNSSLATTEEYAGPSTDLIVDTVQDQAIKDLALDLAYSVYAAVGDTMGEDCTVSETDQQFDCLGENIVTVSLRPNSGDELELSVRSGDAHEYFSLHTSNHEAIVLEATKIAVDFFEENPR